MNANSTAAAARPGPAGLVDAALVNFRAAPGLHIGLAVCLVFVVLLQRLSSPRLDPREPPVLKPRVPLIGHILGLMRRKSDYFVDLYQRKPLPAATLPMLNGKVYAVWSPPLVQAVLRSRHMTFDIFGLEFAQRVFGLSDESMATLWGNGRLEDTVVPKIMSAIKGAMMGQNLYRMNVRALEYVASRINAIDEKGLEVDNLFVWLRELIAVATADALWGEENPVRKDPTILDSLWEFDANIQPLFLGFAPSVIARKAYKARERVQAELKKYYRAGYFNNADAAEITRVRARGLLEGGLSVDEVGKLEMALLHVSTTNTIPTLFWIVVLVLLRPGVADRIREEALPVVRFNDLEDGRRREAVVDITQLEERCPLMVSCYREAIRLANQGIDTRRVMEDAVVSDGAGNSYLFKKGTDIMISVKALHLQPDTWGPDAADFRADRFVSSNAANDEAEKRKRASYIPFGGGKHLCPGRNFAFAENLGFMTALLLGYEVEGLRAENVKMPPAEIGEAVTKPAPGGQGGAVRIERRKGWEDVVWKFSC